MMELLVFYILLIALPIIIAVLVKDKALKGLLLLIYLVINIGLSILLLAADDNCSPGTLFCFRASALVIFQIPIYISLTVCLLLNKTGKKKSYHYDDQ